MKKYRLKLSLIFMLGISITLGILITTYNIFTFNKLSNLAISALDIDKKNNDILCQNLLLAIIKKSANGYSQSFRKNVNTTKVTAQTAKIKLENLNNNKLSDNKIVLKKRRNVWFYNSPEVGFADYWGKSQNIPSKIQEQINSLAIFLPSFKLIFNETPNLKAIWIICKNGCTLRYPSLTEQEIEFYQTKNSLPAVFLKHYFLNEAKQTFKTEKSIVTKPYIGILGEIVVTVLSPVFDNSGKLIAQIGIDLDFEKLSKEMIFNNLFQHNKSKSDLFKGFLFILDNKGNIIHLNEKYYKLFSLPHNHLNLQDYLQEKTVKLTNSKNPDLQNLGEKMLTDRAGVKTLNLNGTSYIIAYSKIESANWTLACTFQQSYILNSAIKTEEKMEQIKSTILKHFFWIFLTALLISLFLINQLFNKFFIKPINNIKKEIEKVNDKNFDINLEEEVSLEISELSFAFNYLGKEIKKNIENIKKEANARKSMETELKIAAKIQQMILPEAANFPTNNFFTLSTKLDAAKNVSGDFYDFFYLNKNKIAIVIADVSGKGLPAAFFMAMSKVLIKNHCYMETNDPGKVLTNVNQALCMDNSSQMFVTVFLIFYDITNGTVLYSNAGHHQAAMLGKDGVKYFGKMKTVAMGILDQIDYTSEQIILNIENTLLLCTDGIFEAISPNEEEYGIERLKNLLSKNKNMPPELLCNTITNDIDKFEAGNRFDDITLVALKRSR